MTKKDQYEQTHPVIDEYRNWKIRMYNGLYIVNRSVGVHSIITAKLDSAKNQIDEWIEHGLTQDEKYY